MASNSASSTSATHRTLSESPSRSPITITARVVTKKTTHTTSSATSSNSSKPALASSYRSTRWPSRFMILTGLGHNFAGLKMAGIRVPFLTAISEGYLNRFSSGVVGATNFDFARSHAFWFLFAGAQMILLGQFMNWYLFPTPDQDPQAQEREEKEEEENRESKDKVVEGLMEEAQVSNKKLPKALGYTLMVHGVLGAMAFPVSGFYLAGIQGLAIVLSK